MELRDWQQQVYATEKSKGWHEIQPVPTFGDRLALVVEELGEMMKEYRTHHEPTEIYFNPEKPSKPEGIPIEAADVVIRVMNLCSHYGIDLEEAIRMKDAYNQTRQPLHGGLRL